MLVVQGSNSSALSQGTLVRGQSTQSQIKDVVLASIGTVFVVTGLWGLYGLHNGFSGETMLIYPSDLHPGISGFFYSDPLRRFASSFYHLSYVIGEFIGERGSFVPYQVVYAALWILRAVLTYLIVQRLMPEAPALAFFACLFAALDVAADSALNWIGQLNQFGFIFLMLLSFFLLLLALDSRRTLTAICWALASATCAYLALWSYESPLPVMYVFPAAVALLRRDMFGRRSAILIIIYLLPVLAFTAENAERYLTSLGNGAASYQASVARTHFSLVALTSDLWLHLENSVTPWRWPQAYFNSQLIWYYAIGFVPVLGGISLLAYAAISREEKSSRQFRVDHQLLFFASASFVLLVASELVILLLRDNRSLWRTEFLPGFASACILSAALYAAIAVCRNHSFRVFATVVSLSTVGAFASLAGVNSAIYFHGLWERQRLVLASIISNAPRVANGTLFVIRNISRTRDPFGDNMWLDVALRLAYPGTIVAGIYTFTDGTPAPHMNVGIEDGEPHLTRNGFATLFHSTPTQRIRHIIVFDLDPSSGEADPVSEGPVRVSNGEIPAARYDFCAAIVGSTPDPMAVRRYGPIAADNRIDCLKGGLP